MQTTISPAGLTLKAERLGPLPVVNHFLKRLGLNDLLEQFVPTRNDRAKIAYSRALGVLLRSIIVEREPLYRQHETVLSFTPKEFGIDSREAAALNDDTVGRALDRLFVADRGSLLTECIVAAEERFGISFKELHNDSTSISFHGQYTAADGRSIRGKRAPWITYGYSKQRRPDLKQLLFILSTSVDGTVPVGFRCENGNRNDTKTHLETWKSLCRVAGRKDFLYVADCKLCSGEVMETIHGEGGRFVTVMPRSRAEDRQFREWVQETTPEWQKVRDLPNPRRKHGLRDLWYVFRHPVPSQENWPVTWVFSTLLRIHQRRSRQDRIDIAKRDLERFREQIDAPKARSRSQFQVEDRLQRILARWHVRNYIRAWVYEKDHEEFRQERPGRPGPDTRYVKKRTKRLSIAYEVDTKAVEYDMRSDGMYPLLCNDRSLSPKQVFEAHKRQPKLERRFRQLKSVHEIAPVFLKNEGRIEALFFLYFLALLVQGLIERELRLAMERSGIQDLPIYPEERRSAQPTSDMILKLFSHAQRSLLLHKGEEIKVFDPELSNLQQEVLHLLGVPIERFTAASGC